MGLKLIEEIEEAARYVRGLEAKASSVEATCEDLSRIIACFVRLQGGMIPASVWDEVHQRVGFVTFSQRLVRDGVQITVTEPSDSITGERAMDECTGHRELLAAISDQLIRWATESRDGGWSTHQVEPQLALAMRIESHLVRTKDDTPKHA